MEITYSDKTTFIGFKLFGEMVWLSKTRSEALDARLLAERLREDFGAQVKKARKEAYEQGFKDAKSKRRKQDWFSEVI